ncbi:MAG: sigma-70 family RNA polymerase sigma factor [Planctomycetes bacterium]|nr:sigma-70 family RNA polymerase sigma factor [Planctomycetota bacterium]
MVANEEREPRTLTRAELDALIERHLSVLRYYVRLRAGPLLRSKEPVSDIVQSTLREIIESGTGFVYSGDGAFRRWIHRIATNKIISKNRYHLAAMRNAAREESLASRVWDVAQPGGSSPDHSPSQHAVHVEDLERLQFAFDALDEEERQILSMRRIFDIPTPQIAEELGIAESTVRWRLATIVAKLASRMG